jgi:glycerophosphoryl diester phosphodiesterase
VAGSPTSPAGAERTRLRRVGHKGADAVVTGNTVASFEAAVGIGVEMIELDVLRLRDGSPRAPAAGRSPLVVAHDWHDAEQRPRLTLAEALDAFTRPPLEEVEIDCDLKLPGREDELVDALRERSLIERAMVSTMYVESLEAIRALEPDLRRGWTYPKVTRPWDKRPLARPIIPAVLTAMRARLPSIVRRRAPELALSALWAYHPVVSRRLVAACHGIGIELIAWTVDEPARIERLRALGVDGICTNDPRLLAG